MKSVRKIKITLIIFLLLMVTGCTSAEPSPEIFVKKEEISIPGLKDDHSFYFIADSHISICDERDGGLTEKAALRAEAFKHGGVPAWESFSALIYETDRNKGEIVILGGDILDSAMYASIDFLEKGLEDMSSEYIYLMGNHDFEYGDEYFSQKAYAEYLPRFKNIHDGKPYRIKDMGEYIIFAVSDSNSQIDPESLKAFKELMDTDKPVVLALHVPIEPRTGDNSLLEASIQKWGAGSSGGSKVIMGDNGVIPNDVTKEFTDMVLSEESPVVLVLAGHVHFYHRDMLNDKVVQIVSNAAFEGESLYITLKAGEH